MPSIFTSGAFIQQCFAVHPLCLSIKMVTLPSKIGISCSNCKMRHRITLESLALLTPETTILESTKSPPIDHCAEHHIDDLRVQAINIEKNFLQIRCRPCKISYHLTIGMIESYQP